MCLKQSSTANRMPLTRSPESALAAEIENIKIPYIMELYWKWIWSTIRKPGDSKTDKAITCDCFRPPAGAEEVKLSLVSVQIFDHKT